MRRLAALVIVVFSHLVLASQQRFRITLHRRKQAKECLERKRRINLFANRFRFRELCSNKSLQCLRAKFPDQCTKWSAHERAGTRNRYRHGNTDGRRAG
ncbi:tRNA-specific adenosine-34 deaminase [Ochrobactrum soli]|uniref:tRNA-specific adenosine-34 deaminase n=1 Tax=Ochrobactrum soli TaxID=2448455 RepID=A0A2P9HIK6_9HYPH|nr:tRNA-specific adenosine-34 deaminase [[Ochrobactrum] soli]